MIVSASRRTDIPAFYGEWFCRRLEAGWCTVPNPFNPRQVSTVSLRREHVHAFVFWTRDPRRFRPALDLLDRRGDPYVVLFTLTAYGPPLELYAPREEEAVEAFVTLARRLGKERVIWRYDPVVLGPGLQVEDHLRRFRRLAAALSGHTETVKISLVDLYRKTTRRLSELEGGERFLVDPVDHARLGELVRGLADAAAAAGMGLETCAEPVLVTEHGLAAGRCIDVELLHRLFGLPPSRQRDRGQREHCRCAPSRDIGRPDSCLHGCAYCYATRSHRAARANHSRHRSGGECLFG